MEKVKINTEYIKLDQFLKWVGAAESGSFAKMMVENGDVLVNGQVTMKRGRKLRIGDIVEVRDAGSFEIV